jgi:hypothetical protein
MKTLAALALAFFVAAGCGGAAFAQTQIAPDADSSGGSSGGLSGGSSLGGKLTNHGGPVMPNARVVYLFWGQIGSDYADELRAYRDHSAGMRAHMSMLSQYNASQTTLTSLTQADVYDTSEPPVAIADADLRAAVARNFAGRYDNSVIYTIILPNGHYTVRSGSTSCGGSAKPGYCGFHDSYYDAASGIHVKYAAVPFVSCDDCLVVAANGAQADAVQSAEVVVVHEVREAMTDPLYSAWYTGDFAGQIEADDKCAWHASGGPTPANIFYTAVPAGAYDTPYWHPGYFFFFQKEWSNSANGCVQ